MTTSRFIISGSTLCRTTMKATVRAPLRAPKLSTVLAKRSLSTTPRSLSASVAPSVTSIKDVDLNPPNWDTRARERYEISPFGYIMPRIYIPMSEVFPLPEDADKEEIVKNLSKGLEATIGRFPFLAGDLENDPEKGCLWVTTENAQKVQLIVRDHSNDLPSFEEMEANDFPSQAFGMADVLPDNVHGGPYLFATEESLKSRPVSGFQVTFIKGGVIVSLSVHHHISDATGLDALFKEWARNSAALAAGKTLETSPYQYKVTGTSYHVPTPSPAKIKILNQKHSNIINWGTTLSPIEPPSKFMSRLWHFPRTSLNDLKKQVSSTLPEGAWVSTYDVMLAVLWMRIVRARSPITDANDNYAPLLTHAINGRGNLFPPMGNEHIACGTTIARVEPTTLGTLKEFNPVNVGKVALDIRDSIRETRNCSWLHSEMQYIQSQKDKRFLAVDLKNFRDLDLCASSWRELTTYQTHDFGFGLPHALRMPDPQNEGYVFIYPSRAHLKPAGSNEGTEAVVLLDEESQKRLMKDEILLKYAHPRGV